MQNRGPENIEFQISIGFPNNFLFLFSHQKHFLLSMVLIASNSKSFCSAPNLIVHTGVFGLKADHCHLLKVSLSRGLITQQAKGNVMRS